MVAVASAPHPLFTKRQKNKHGNRDNCETIGLRGPWALFDKWAIDCCLILAND